MGNIKIRPREMGKENKMISTLLRDQKGVRALRDNHPAQREAQQWNIIEKSNFCRRLLWNESCPALYVVETKDDTGVATRWLIDGKQRFTTIEDFVNDKFKIHKKTRMPSVPYIEYVYEEVNGRMERKKDENGNFIFEIKEFDIRGKKFSELPLDLQDVFLSCELTIDVRKNGTIDDVRNDILDYNSGKPMNAAQIGVNNLGVDHAVEVRKLAKHEFITDCCGFNETDVKKGNDLRAISEGIMLSNFPDDWKSSFQENGNFLNKNLDRSIIEETKNNYDRLYEIIPSSDEEIEKFLTLKEFPVVMACYDYFLSKDIEDKYFGKFLNEWCKVTAIQITEELIDKNGNPCDYRTYFRDGGKTKNKMLERVLFMEEALDKYLKENGVSELDE